MDKAWFTNQFISGSSQNKVVANDSWFTVNSAFMYQLLDCCTILVDAYLSVKQQVFNFIGQVSFYPKFIRQTQKSVLCWTNIGSTQINIANMRVLKTSKPTCRSIILWYTMGSLILLGIILCRFNQDNIFFDTEMLSMVSLVNNKICCYNDYFALLMSQQRNSRKVAWNKYWWIHSDLKLKLDRIASPVKLCSSTFMRDF